MVGDYDVDDARAEIVDGVGSVGGIPLDAEVFVLTICKVRFLSFSGVHCDVVDEE